MAGDIGIQEQAIVLPPAGAATSKGVALSLQQVQGRAMHYYGPRVIIAEVPPEAEEAVQAISFMEMGPKSSAIPTEVRDDLGLTGSLGLKAFDHRQTKGYANAKANRPLAGESWGTAEAQEPDAHEAQSEELAASAAMAGAATSSRLTGSVAVGLIIVEGPTAGLKFSSSEQTKVVAEVQNGLGWLGSYSTPAGVSWHYDIHIVTIDATPGSDSLTLAQKEALWRDPAMASLGYAAGMSGVQKYVEDLRDDKGTDWAYCAFFTKYPVGHFAYASIGGPRLVMHYDNDGWGPDNIDRVFAHETGHIFGAPDEYASSGCNCGGSWGFYNVPNGNCANCADGGGVPCIMKSNSWEMCSFTPYHLGFPQEHRYSGVWVKGSGGYGLWVNASWSYFVNKWQEWAKKGLRLRDLKITKVGSQNRYSGVWEQKSGGYGLWVNASWTSFVNKWQEWAGKGLRLVDLEITQFDGQTRYSGVWQQMSGGYGLWVNASWTSFVNKWQEWAGKGLRLIDIEITQVGGQNRYSGVWVQGSGGYGLWVNASWTSFVNKWQEWNGKGLRLVDLEITKVGGQTRYSGVWQQMSGGYGLWVNTDWAGFLGKWKEWSEDGLRLIDLEIMTPEGGANAQPAGSAFPEGIGLGDTSPASSGSDPEEAGFGESYIADDIAAAEGGAGYGEIFIEEEAAAETGSGFGESVVDEPEMTEGDGGFGEIVVEDTVLVDEVDGFGAEFLE